MSPTRRRCTVPLVLVSALAGAHAPGEADAFEIQPFVDCIESLPGNAGIVANFGYESLELSLVQALVGPDNSFSPLPVDRGQPSVFFPGFRQRAFRVSFPSDPNNPTLLWTLLGNRVFANTGVRPCPPEPAVRVPASLRVVAGGTQRVPRSTPFQPIRVAIGALGRSLVGARVTALAPSSGPGGMVMVPAGGLVSDEFGEVQINVLANDQPGAWSLAINFGATQAPIATIRVELTNQ